jgi:hypothetical protein
VVSFMLRSLQPSSRCNETHSELILFFFRLILQWFGVHAVTLRDGKHEGFGVNLLFLTMGLVGSDSLAYSLKNVIISSHCVCVCVCLYG